MDFLRTEGYYIMAKSLYHELKVVRDRKYHVLGSITSITGARSLEGHGIDHPTSSTNQPLPSRPRPTSKRDSPDIQGKILIILRSVTHCRSSCLPQQALGSFRRSLLLEPSNAAYHFSMGTALQVACVC